jgi:hypothetical protein
MEKNEELRVPMAEHMVHMWHSCPQQIQVKLLISSQLSTADTGKASHQFTAVHSRYR